MAHNGREPEVFAGIGSAAGGVRSLVASWAALAVLAVLAACAGPEPASPRARSPVQGTLGMSARVVRQDAVLQDLTVRPTQYILITRVDPGGPAARAKIRPGDVLVSIDGRPTDRAAVAIEAVRGATPGRKLMLGIRRGGKTYSIEVVAARFVDGAGAAP